MNQSYKQISYDERIRIALLLGAGLSVRAIARELSRAPSTILREIRRNFPASGEGDHLARNADAKALQRRRCPRIASKMCSPVLESYVREKVMLGWSPELVAGRIHIDLPNYSISHESIYYYIYHKARELIPYLPQSRRQRRPRRSQRKHRGTPIPHRISITERPKAANERSEIGHWEIDTMLSCLTGKAALAVAVDRKTRFTRIAKLKTKSASTLERALARLFSPLDRSLRKTFTYDNGAENARHEQLNQILDTSSFFCHAYHSWEKGTVENTISLIRRFIPPSSNLDPVSKAQIKKIENWLNSRPRKCLNFLTPHEILSNCVALRI